jgi:hypothetical protein
MSCRKGLVGGAQNMIDFLALGGRTVDLLRRLLIDRSICASNETSRGVCGNTKLQQQKCILYQNMYVETVKVRVCC